MTRDLTKQRPVENDGQLLDRIRGGDQPALVSLFDRHSQVVFAVALRVLGDPSAAEDVMQDVFLRLWRKPPVLQGASGSLAGWFAVLARNRAIDQLRRRHVTESADDVILMSPVDVAEESERHLLLERARRMMLSLPQEQQVVLELAFFGGLSHSEIAERLDSPLGTIKTRLRRAVLTLRKAAHA